MSFDFDAQACTLRCSVCPAASACVIRGAAREEVERWNASVENQVSLPVAGKTLFEAGSPATAIYAVRAGCLKSFTVDTDGTERVRGFYLPGDEFGWVSVRFSTA